MMSDTLLQTTVVGSYPQPDWLVDRDLLAKGVPRTRLRELWRGQDPWLQQAQDDRQVTDRELSLKQAAAKVSAQRVEELKKQLQMVEARAAAEAADATKLREKSALLEQRVARIQADLPAHEAADAAVAVATRAKARLEAMQTARRALQTQLAGLRKSSVEWRSRGAEAEQQVAALTAQRPELDKKTAEAKAAADKAEMVVTTAKAAMEAATVTLTGATAAVAETTAHAADAKASADRMQQSADSLEKSLATLKEAAKLIAKVPELRIVLNHTGLPWDRSEDGLAHWREGMRALAAMPQVFCKISELGLLHAAWTVESNRRVVVEAIDIFGPSRCMFASNFPVAGLRVGYLAQVLGINEMLQYLTVSERQDIFVNNAISFYRIQPFYKQDRRH